MIDFIKNLFKKHKCEHDFKFVHNIYGDAINYCGGYRSLWKCSKCGKVEYRKYLQTSTICDKLDKLYNEYYKNKYEKWCDEHKDSLNNMLQQMINHAEKGLCWIDFTIACKEDSNDRNYYEKWFNENKLKVEIELVGDTKFSKVNNYLFRIHWKYNY